MLQEEEKRLRSYDSLFDDSKMASNSEVAASGDASASIAFEDDFMVRNVLCSHVLLYVKPYQRYRSVRKSKYHLGIIMYIQPFLTFRRRVIVVVRRMVPMPPRQTGKGGRRVVYFTPSASIDLSLRCSAQPATSSEQPIQRLD